MVVRKFALYTIAKVNGHYIRIYWSWYQQENENKLLQQLKQILEDDDD